ncbi:DUF1178 family protein [Sphingomonas sp. 37zxx]|uniref:DUF1178 family protein n=1 Tax=Sphingomonas sp. 37zxx TaxID=1550073 RepID=UPI00053BF4DE|nr:DUF1178 family protein [Sphingomonas sp. 37zxx]
MIVFDLRCPANHVFEAWFGNSAAYADQRERGLIACPVCGDTAIEKALMAPNIAAKGNRAVEAAPKPIGDAPTPEGIKAAIATIAAAQAKLLEKSAWVGRSFPDRARAMHLGEEAAAPIHGQATPAEARALVDEGVAIAPLPLPVVPPTSRH